MSKILSRGSHNGSEFITPLDFLPSVADDHSDLDAIEMKLSTVTYDEYMTMKIRGEFI